MATKDYQVARAADKEEKLSVVALSSNEVTETYRVARFRGRPMIMVNEPYDHFVPLHKERFDQIAYPILGGVSRSRMSDVFAYLGNTAQDLTDFDRYVMFGTTAPIDSDDPGEMPTSNYQIWDMEDLSLVVHVPPTYAIWRSPYAMAPIKSRESEPLEFVMQLVGGDQGLYDDIMQSLAPLIMAKKPDGVVWWVGDGANGKSTLMDAIYRIFPGQLSSITVKRLTDGRDTPSLNGTLANIVKESSEGRIDDTEIYKSIGTHEDFRVHKFHSQDDITIRGNIHHIFSGNSIPAFNDKGHSARRRTFIIPFKERFESDPTFEDRIFTEKMFGELILEMIKFAQRIKRQGYKYKWSAATLAAKLDYDGEANNAEEYAKHIISEGLVAFDSFTPVKIDYENWCAGEGYVPLGLGNLRRAVQTVGFEKYTVRSDDGKFAKRYKLPNFVDSELTPIGLMKPGMFTTAGMKSTVEEVKPAEPDTPIQSTLLKGKW